jgi:hypothetical protein
VASGPIYILLMSTAWRVVSPCCSFNNTSPFPFTVPVPVPIPIPFFCCTPLPLPMLSRLLFRLSTLCSLPFPRSFLNPLRVLLTLAVIIVIAIARTTPSTARHCGILPGLIIIILVDYRMSIQWSNSQEVTWFVLLPVWWLNLCPGIIAAGPRDMLSAVFNLPQAGCLWVGAIDLIPEGQGVIPPSLVQLVAGFVKHLPHI